MGIWKSNPLRPNRKSEGIQDNVIDMYVFKRRGAIRVCVCDIETNTRNPSGVVTCCFELKN